MSDLVCDRRIHRPNGPKYRPEEAVLMFDAAFFDAVGLLHDLCHVSLTLGDGLHANAP